MNSQFKLLVVDDDLLFRQFLKAILSKKYEVYSVGEVNSFYNIINQIKFDLIIMDVALRDVKNGYQLTKELKADEKYKGIPVFIYTAFNSTKENQIAREVGADLFMTKQANTSEFFKMIDSKLSKSNSSQMMYS